MWEFYQAKPDKIWDLESNVTLFQGLKILLSQLSYLDLILTAYSQIFVNKCF